MIDTEGGATGGHGSPDAGQMSGHDICVTLDDHCLLASGNLLASEIDAIKNLRLLVERCLRGVEVLGAFIVVSQFPSSEPDDLAGQVADRPEEAAAKPVVWPTLARDCQSAGDQFLVSEVLCAQVFGQPIPRVGRIANPEMFGGCLIKVSFLEELASDSASGPLSCSA